VLAGRSKMSVRLLNPIRGNEERQHRRRGKWGKRGQRCRPRTLGIRAGQIGVRMLTMSSMVMVATNVHGVRRVRTAQHNLSPPRHRLKHEADRDQRPEQKRRCHPQREPQSMPSEQRQSWSHGGEFTAALERYPICKSVPPGCDLFCPFAMVITTTVSGVSFAVSAGQKAPRG
jgi:hypothetical protein